MRQSLYVFYYHVISSWFRLMHGEAARFWQKAIIVLAILVIVLYKFHLSSDPWNG